MGKPRTIRNQILVTGDVVVDHHIYQGLRPTPDSKEFQGSGINIRLGGARLLFEIIERVSNLSAKKAKEARDKEKKTKSETEKDIIECIAQFGFALDPGKLIKKLKTGYHSYALWSPCLKDDKAKTKVWRVTQPMGYGNKIEHALDYKDLLPTGDAGSSSRAKPSIVVLDDAALGFRHNINQDAWPQIIKDSSADAIDWVILKMSKPIAQGDLWRSLNNAFRKKLIVVVSIDDLREKEVGISKGLSWDRTVHELLFALESNTSTRDLLKCRHLIVSFGVEGALWVNTSGDNLECHLIYDPECFEGEWCDNIKGQVFGHLSCLVAGIVNQLMKPASEMNIGVGIISGLSATRCLLREGHGAVGADNKPGFPFDKVTEEILGVSKRDYRIGNVPVSLERGNSINGGLTIAEDNQENTEPLYRLAMWIALYGSMVFSDISYAKFGKVFVVDRSEIESLRGLQRLVKNYVDKPKVSQPLSIAVFGSPGSGKSFGVKQIARAVLGEKVPILEFNLSQFSSPGDLIGAFHQVRDEVLEGQTPFVFWDEFDSKEFMWLQYLLAPMQDGKFQEGQLSHPIGKCIFVFAGGTSYTMENFGPHDKDSEDFKKFKLLKGPDFVSRLSGYLNVIGPNRRQKYDYERGDWVDDNSPVDIYFPVRRALLIRAILGLNENETLDIDKGLLNALLRIDKYNHGARSLTTIISLTKRPGSKTLMRSDLPPQEQMSLHLNYEKFMELLNRDLRFKVNAETLALEIHEFYRQLCKKNGWEFKYDMAYQALPIDIKADNIVAAERIPEVLYLAGLTLVPSSDTGMSSEKEISDIIEANIEVLAAAEHDGWMRQKLINGWVLGPRNDDKKVHNALVPYSNLDEKDKEKDRNSVRNYPEIVSRVNYKIVQSEQDETTREDS